MRCATLPALLTAAALGLGPLGAAAEPRAGVLPLDVEGKLPPNGAKALAAGVDEGLHDAGATVVPPGELSRAAGTKLAACRDAACLQDVAAKASASHLLRPSVRMQDSDYVIALELVDGATGAVAHQVTDTCELCGLVEAQAMARSLAASMKDHLAAAATGTVTITSTPSGAEVLVDGQPAGTTPLELSLAAGEHALVLRQAGRVDEERRVVVEAGSTAAVAVELAATSPHPGDEPGAPRPILRPLGFAALGVGVASLASGVALLVLDERPVDYTRCSGIDVDVEGNCRFRHDTLAGGVVMTVVGVVGIAAGAVLVARTRKAPRDDRRARVQPTARGLAIRF